MRFGKISAIFLGIFAATFFAVLILRPGWGNPLAALGGLLMTLSFFATLVFGIVGIICDRRKLLAIITTIIAGGYLLFNLVVTGIIMMCRWTCRQIRMARSTRTDRTGSSGNLLVFSTGEIRKVLLCSGRLPGCGSGLPGYGGLRPDERRDERPDEP